MLDIDIRPVAQGSAVVVMAGSARGAVGQVSGPQSHCVTMRMAVEVVRRMTLAAVTGRCRWGVGGGVVAGGAAVMLLDVRCIDEVRVIHRHGMAGATFCL